MEDPGLVARFSGPDFTKNFGCRGNTVERGGGRQKNPGLPKWCALRRGNGALKPHDHFTTLEGRDSKPPLIYP